MDTELAKLKSECDQKVKDAKQQIEYNNGENNEADEERIALLLNNGTQVLKIKNLERQANAREREIKLLKEEKLTLQAEVEKFAKTNDELYQQNEELNE